MNKESKYITVLDFEVGEIYQYESVMCDFEEFKLKQAIKEANDKEFDKWMNKLIKKNGKTNY